MSEFDWLLREEKPAVEIRRAKVSFGAFPQPDRLKVRVKGSVGVFVDEPKLRSDHSGETRVAPAEVASVNGV